MISSVDDKWHRRFLDLANLVSTWSKDPSTAVGACAIDPTNRNILAVGYNGFPRGISDDERLNHKETKYPLIVHAEMNVIFNAGFNGIKLGGSYLYIYGLPPCLDCTKGIIQAGFSKLIIPEISYWGDINPKWLNSFEYSKSYCAEAGLELLQIEIV
jgi:dCMP deaminase